MILPPPPRRFADLRAGDAYEFGAYRVTKDEIIAFAQQFDPQPFHLDEEAGKRSLLKGLASSGWHTASMAMRMLVDNVLLDEAFQISPGIPQLSWMKPVYVDETLRMQAHVKSARTSASRPGVGIAEIEYTMLNQNDDRKMVYSGTTFIGAGAALTAPPAGDAREPEPRGLNDPAALADNVSLLSGYWDDQPIGQTFDMGTYHFDADSVTAFARLYDPQPFHTDSQAALSGPFGALSASGWHTASAAMRRLVLSRAPYREEAQRRGLKDPERGPSPGFRDLKWLLPVYAGDTLRYTMTPIDKRKTSREGWGIVFTKVEGWNQRGEKPFEYVSASLWRIRD